ncbi:hypothetical protein BKA70DRAFT_1217438 [Coprinopsis sp. MPI-PUGE-AT-0042]|nr:hypothetical protein BKA70DRAFT_1217438 [Coprinopsis sp. MPI-PUGE-AT-0042]
MATGDPARDQFETRLEALGVKSRIVTRWRRAVTEMTMAGTMGMNLVLLNYDFPPREILKAMCAVPVLGPRKGKSFELQRAFKLHPKDRQAQRLKHFGARSLQRLSVCGHAGCQGEAVLGWGPVVWES